MDHDAVREQIELAAVEPDGLERLMAGDTPDRAGGRGAPRRLPGVHGGARAPAALGRRSSARRSGRCRRPTCGRGRWPRSVPKGSCGRCRGRRGRGVAAGPAVARRARARRRAASGARAARPPPAPRARPRLGRGDRRRRRPVGRRDVATSSDRGSTTSSPPRRSTIEGLQEITTRDADGHRPARRRARRPRRRHGPGALRRPDLLAVDRGARGRRHGLTPPPAGQEYRCWVEVDGKRQRVGKMFFNEDLAYWVGPAPAVAGLSTGATFGVSLVDAAGSAVDTDPVLLGEL